MRISPTLFAVVLCAASTFAAHGQQAVTSGPARGPVGTAKAPSGMSFAYDANQKQIVASGVHLSTGTIKSNSVSPTTGTINVTIHIKIVSGFESGTTYHCSVNAVGGIIDLDNGTIDGGLETANNFAVVTAPGVAQCTLKIPYSWTLPHDGGAESGLILAFGVAAVNTHSEVERSTLQVDGIENLPPSGAASNFVFTVAL